MISIIIPIYNVASYIEACMQSICEQTYRDFEVILVDDCGQDNSVQLAVETLRGGGIEAIVLRHEHNRGLSAARNTGMTVAQGKYVLFVDSDDMLVARSLELLHQEAERTGADMTYGSYETFGDEARFHQAQGSPYVMAWNKLCRRSFLSDNHISFIEGLIHEDCPWSFELECKASKIAMVKEVTYRYLIRKGGLQTAGEYTRHFKSYCTILKSYAKTIAESISTGCRTKSSFVDWFERQKALFFAMTLDQGTFLQQKEIYSLIRSLKPIPPFSKADCHYYLPAFLGIVLYKKFHSYHLC